MIIGTQEFARSTNVLPFSLSCSSQLVHSDVDRSSSSSELEKLMRWCWCWCWCCWCCWCSRSGGIVFPGLLCLRTGTGPGPPRPPIIDCLQSTTAGPNWCSGGWWCEDLDDWLPVPVLCDTPSS